MRPTRDVIAIVFTIAGAAAMLLGLAGVITLELVHPEANTTPALEALIDVTALMLGAGIGFLVGRHS
jgi:hypothetical protein